ncbi:exported hypothetical protein [Gammaproteobacteria bacterium]
MSYALSCLVLTLVLGALTIAQATETPQLVIDPGGHTAIIWSVMFSPDGGLTLRTKLVPWVWFVRQKNA